MHLQACKPACVAIVMFSFFVNLLMLTVPVYLLQLYDRVIPNQNSDTLIFLTLLAVLALVTLAILEYVRSSVLKEVGSWLDLQLSSHLLSASISRSVQKHQTSSARIFDDLAIVRNFLSGNTLLSLLDVPWAPFFIAVLFILHPLIGGITLFGVVVLAGLAVVNEYTTRKQSKHSHDVTNHLMDYATSVMRNAEAIEAMGMREQLINHWNRKNQSSLELHAHNQYRTTCISSVAKFFRFLLQVSIVCSAAWLIMNNQLTGGAMIASVLLMRRAVAPMEQAINSWKSVLQVRNALDDVSKRLSSSPTLQSTQASVPPLPGQRLKVDHVGYRYHKQSGPILHNISFRLTPGHCLGIGGQTAAGKSTLARLLVGLVKPGHGRIILGDANIHTLTANERSTLIGFLPQDVELFAGSIQDNIARMDHSQLQSVVEAAETAGVHDMIMSLPDKYLTQIGEGGTQLSGGQRQRIALARAVFRNPALVVLDEPDANLDIDGRVTLSKAIKRLKAKGTMLIIISHDPGMLAMADNIVELYPTKHGSSATIRSPRIKPRRLHKKRGHEQSPGITTNTDYQQHKPDQYSETSRQPAISKAEQPTARRTRDQADKRRSTATLTLLKHE